MCLVIEFHDIDLNKQNIKEFIEKFELKLVHIHVKDSGWLNDENVPPILECTFSQKQFVEKRNAGDLLFPINLDSPNNHKLKSDRKIVFF